jgi:hypothetical protein
LLVVPRPNFRSTTAPPLELAAAPAATTSGDVPRAAPSTSALAAYAALLDARDAAQGAQRLSAALAAEGGFDRVSIGLVESGRTRLIASSHGDPSQLPPELRQWIEGAMDEALEQALTLSWPQSAGEVGAIV